LAFAQVKYHCTISGIFSQFSTAQDQQKVGMRIIQGLQNFTLQQT